MMYPKKRKGNLVVIEGMDGTGKSTQARLLCKWLEERGMNARLTREPGGTRAGEVIRNMVLKAMDVHIAVMTETLLMLAARSQHLEEVIRPGLEAGQFIVCDRFRTSTYAYQGAGGGIDNATLEALEQASATDLEPDLVIVLDCEGEEARSVTGAGDRIEQRDGSYHDRVTESYRKWAKDPQGKAELVDARGTVEEVRTRICGVMTRCWPGLEGT